MCPMSAILYSTTVGRKTKQTVKSRPRHTKRRILQSFEGRADARTQGNISGHAESDGLGEWRGLGEEVQVVEGKDQLDGFIHLNRNLNTGREEPRT